MSSWKYLTERRLAVLEWPHVYSRHDSSKVILGAALLALLGDHSALSPLTATVSKHCRRCTWPHGVELRTKEQSRAAVTEMFELLDRGGRGDKGTAYNMSRETGLHIHSVNIICKIIFKHTFTSLRLCIIQYMKNTK